MIVYGKLAKDFYVYTRLVRVIDAFPFFNELDLLKLRLETLDPYVDLFVVSEATTTFSGKSKPLYLTENLSAFAAWEEKLRVSVVDIEPTSDPHINDPAQKNLVKRALEPLCEGDDIVLWGDADEIPNPEVIQSARDLLQETSTLHFAQFLHYYYLDVREVSGNLLSSSGDFDGITHPKWIGTRAMKWRDLRHRELNSLRERSSLSEGLRIDNAGWHFSFVGSPGLGLDERVDVKIAAYAHQELNRLRFRVGRSSRLRRGKDVFGRRSDFRLCPRDQLPSPVIERPGNYENLLCPSDLALKLRPLDQRP